MKGDGITAVQTADDSRSVSLSVVGKAAREITVSIVCDNEVASGTFVLPGGANVNVCVEGTTLKVE